MSSREIFMTPGKARQKVDRAAELPPRARILKAAHDLFYHQGIRAVGVELVAAEAETNKMTLYRHFTSKDALVAEYLREVAAEIEANWDRLGIKHAVDPVGHILAWLAETGRQMERPGSRGCPITNAAIELPEPDHPGRVVIEGHKRGMRKRFAERCRAAGLKDADMLADQLVMLLDGAGVAMQTIGLKGPVASLLRHAEWLLGRAESHQKRG
jgi:AcrR family transcriptional regulator